MFLSKKFLFFIGMIFALSFVIFSYAYTAEVDPKSTKYGLDTVADKAELTNFKTVPALLGGIVGTGLSLISVLFFVLIIYGGIIWMTARGDDSKSQKAREIMFAAILGIIIVLSAYVVTSFIFNAVEKGGQASSTQSADKTDKLCTDNGSQCQSGATADEACTVGDKTGTYEPGLCNSNPSSSYLCCFVPSQTPTP